MPSLSTNKKILYGLGGIAMSLPDSVFTQWIFVLYVPDTGNVLVSARVFGLCYFAARVLGAIAEPVVGFWSDRFQSPSGRRLPFVRRVIIPFAVAFFLMWTPPIHHQHWANAIYIYLMMQAYLLCFPTVLTPYLALMPELTPDLRERVTITTFQAVAMMLGTILFAVMGLLLEVGGWLLLGGSVALMMLLSMAPTALVIREKPLAAPNPEGAGLLQSIWSLLQNRPFRYLVAATSLFFFGFNCVVMTLPFWVKVYLHEGDAMVTWLMIPFLAVTLILFAGIGPVVNRFGKYVMFMASLLSIAILLLMLAFVGFLPGLSPLLQIGLLTALLGVPMTGFSVLPFALLMDVIDYDEQRMGERREALFFAVQGTIQKIFLGFSGFAFSILAYMDGGNMVSVLGLRCVIGMAAFTSLLGFLVFLKYPIRERDGRIVVLE